MTAMREAIWLPVVFLTVTLLGGIRTGAVIRLAAPTVSALVLSLLLIAALVRARVLVPAVHMNGFRQPLENANGFVVLLTVFVGSAQLFNLLTPDAGLWYLVFTVFFAIQLLTSMAAIEERARMLRALMVLFGSAFVLRFLVLEPLYGASPSMLQRVLTALLEGVTLGGLKYDAQTPAAGYLAFVTVALYLIGLVSLGSSPPATALQPVPRSSEVIIRTHGD